MYKKSLTNRYGRAVWLLLPGLWLAAGGGVARADDDEHRHDRDRDRDHHAGQVDIGIPGVGGVNVQWGNPSPINAPYTVQTRGPVHEAFAEPILFEPSPGFVIPRRPPDPLDEMPPDVYPVISGNVTWIPGYWAWDDDRGDFLWVSGIWRNVPPGRQFVPGYWLELSTGYEWVSGFWIRDNLETVQYLPQPPESLERGPNSQSPGPNFVWTPGIWLWRDVGYLWRPGYWTPIQPDWVWVPDHYVWAPSGYIFVDGYWDYTLPRRGLLFAPIYVPTQVAAMPRFVYRPTVIVNTSVLVGDLFARPSYSHYYFGDYYERQYFRSGIYPAYAFYDSDYGYDPVFATYVATQRAPRTAVIERMRTDYRYLRDNPNVRPPRTYAGFQQLSGRRDVDPRLATRRNLVEPLSQLSRQGTDQPFRVERLEPDRLSRYRENINQTRQYQQERRRLEGENLRQTPGGAGTGVSIPRAQDGQRDGTRSRVPTPQRPAPQPGTVERTVPEQRQPTAPGERPPSITRTPGQPGTPERPAPPAPERDRATQRPAPPARPGATDTTTPPAQPRAPSITREQLPEETRRQLRERRGIEGEQQTTPGAARPERPAAAKPGQEQPRTGRAATQPSAQPPGQPGQPGVSNASPRGIERRQGNPVQLRLKRSPVGGQAAQGTIQTQPGAARPGERAAPPPPAPKAAQPDANAKPDNRARERRAPKED